MRIDQMLSYIREQLRSANIEEPALEARLFLEKATSLDNTSLIIQAKRELTKEEEANALSSLEKKLNGTPTAYILKEKEFYGLSFYVDERVLIPRPDTETLVETALSYLKGKENIEVLDMCTGSGCVGISISYESGCNVLLTDISSEALEVAKENAERYIKGRYKLKQSDLFQNIERDKKFDVIVSNPPYLTDSWYSEVSIEVKKEPKLAFPGFGNDGLDIIRRIVSEGRSYLKKGGLLALECDFRQCKECVNILHQHNFSDISVIKDLAQRDRVVRGVFNCTNS